MLHIVVYVSSTHILARCNYDMYNEELMVIRNALKKWRLQCEGAPYPLQRVTDYRNLEDYMMTMVRNRQQVRRSEFSSCCDYYIVYWQAKSNGKADTLPRRPGDRPEGGNNILKNVKNVVLKPQNLPEQLCLLADGSPARESLLYKIILLRHMWTIDDQAEFSR